MNYYNENDAKTAAWLRELIAAGLIPAGHVDDRSITDVSAGDLDGFIQCHFFAGIGGWPLALALAGWPEGREVWTGSCPCQPFSQAGKGKGHADERHLWPEFFRLIRERRPVTIIGEQVESAVGHGWLDGISADLEGECYACGAAVLGAHSVGAPHIRKRLYWLADSGHQSARRPAASRQAESRRPLCDAPGCLPRLVQPIGPGLEGYAGNGDDWHKSGRERAGETGSTAATSDAGGLVLADGDGCSQGSAAAATAGHWHSADSAGCGTGGLGKPSLIGDGAAPNGGVADESETEGRERSRGGSSPWGDSVAILCRDGKTRRIPAESMVQRVADELSSGVGNGCDSGVSEARKGHPLSPAQIPGRVMMLRGYGNAIVPACAAEFITAYLDIHGQK